MKSILRQFLLSQGSTYKPKILLAGQNPTYDIQIVLHLSLYILILMIDHHESVRPCVQTMNSPQKPSLY